MSQPVAVGNRFLLYGARGGGLQVVALNVSSGSTAWTAAASPSGIAPGQPPALAVSGSDVFFLAKVGSLAELVARDVTSGRVRWHSAIGEFSSWPSVCPDATSAICLTGVVASAPRGVQLRFDARTGVQLPGALISKTLGGRELGPGLFDPGQRNPELLVATAGARVRWSRPLASVFALPGASSDWGWNFDRIARIGLFVGSPGWKPVTLSTTQYVADLSRSMTAAFRISDGAVAWRSPGMYVCNYLPCPGATEAGFSAPSNAAGSSPTVGLRTREVGTVRGSPNSLPVASAGARITLEGFDPASGHALWRFPAGHDPGLITQRLLPPRISTDAIALRNSHRRLVAVDLNRGSQHPIAASTAAWCRAPILYKQRTPYRAANGERFTHYVGQFALYPCTARGHRRTNPSHVPSFVAAIGARAAGVVAWSDTKAVIAEPAGA